MNQKFTDLVKGRPNGTEILAALKIEDNTKATQTVLDKLQEALQLIDTGVLITDAAKIVLEASQAIAKQGKGSLTPGASPSLVRSPMPQVVNQGLDNLVGEVAQTDIDGLPEALVSYTGGAGDKLGAGLQNYVETTYLNEVGRLMQTEEFKGKVKEAIKKRPRRTWVKK